VISKPTTPAVINFERQVEHLRWGDRGLTKLVHLGARQDVREVEEPTPDLCADAKFWAATGFRELSPATRGYRREHEQHENENPEAERTLAELQGDSIAQRLKHYEDRSDKALARRLKAMQKEALLKLSKAAAASRLT
jgi:hypothetical protein